MKTIVLIALALLLTPCAYFAIAAEKSPQARRESADAELKKGNFKDAYNLYEKLAITPDDEPGKVSNDLTQAIQCLIRLDRADEIDDFREKVIAAHGDNWRLLQTAAESYLAPNENFGFIIAGKFYRGIRHGNDGKQVFSLARDRVHALQLMQQAMNDVKNDPDKIDRANFYFALADMLLNARAGIGAWQFQSLTDLSKLPDYDEGYPPYYYGSQDTHGAPVNPDGTPVYYAIPKSWNDAVDDGQRWRWALSQASQMSAEDESHARFVFASFLRDQFGVQTIALSGYPGYFGGSASDDDAKKDESGPFAVSTLGEDQTIARLASGIKRFTLTPEFNYIHLFQSVSETGKGKYAEDATDALAALFENRQQFDRAAEYWKKSIEKFGDPDGVKKKQVDQILGNWANFDTLETETAGTDAVAQILFRNGTHLHLEASEIDVPKLLADIKAYIKSRPKQLDWEKMNFDAIGWRLVEKHELKYLKGKPVANWEMDLQPRERHFDKRVKIIIPVKNAGAYLVTAKMADGNTTRIVLWHADTAIVKKSLDNGSYYFVADAGTGQPVAKANLEYFGYQQRWTGNGQNFEIDVKNFAENTDADGQVKLTNNQQDNGYQWLITATTEGGRFAYLGFTGIWGGQYYDAQYNEEKVYLITDRPVYRPGDTAKFKFWLGQAQYDKQGASPFANKAFTVIVNNPKGEKVMEKTFTADEFGGFDGEFPLPKDATPGQFQCYVQRAPKQVMGGGSFRVEEYKKPEFEVTVDAPADPVMLGEKISATIKAKYYFGAPVVSAKVKYKITRTSFSANWFPSAPWDWFYEPGYWWFSPDYFWYPGWQSWGVNRPLPLWFGGRSAPPEIIAENDVPIGADGTVKVEIDTAIARAVHGDTDHQYSISAEVTDDSRRTIVGQGTVLVARKPFKVYAWVDRGYYQTGDAIEASFQAQTLDNKPIKGTGLLKLLRITYKENKPVETEVQHWDLNTDDQGTARQQMKADKPGQYRLSYTVTDAFGHAIEGGYVFVIRGQGFDGRDFRFNDIELITDRKEYQAGDTIRLLINTEKPDSTVLLFLRPTNGVYLAPKVIRMKGKSAVEEVGVAVKDMPNFFIEALTVSDAKVRDEVREIVVPPASRVVNVELMPSQSEYKPGEKAKVKFKLTGSDGKPIEASVVLSIYDKSVEYISGGSNVGEIKRFFWKWRRNHYPATESSLLRGTEAITPSSEIAMGYLGIFGLTAVGSDVNSLALGDDAPAGQFRFGAEAHGLGGGRGGFGMPMAPAAPGARLESRAAINGASQHLGVDQLSADASMIAGENRAEEQLKQPAGGPPESVEPTIRKNFADTAFWTASLKSGIDGTGEAELTLPESLTTWKARLWCMSTGTRVGEESVQVVTHKNLIVRLQSPRFFTQTDEVVLSANVHNYLKTAKSVTVSLDLGGNVLAPLSVDNRDNALSQIVQIPAGAEKRIDWRVKVLQPGTAAVRMSARTDEESDAMEMSFPALVHGMLKTESFSGALGLDDKSASLNFTVPQDRLPEQSLVEVRYSPSVASAMVDALPYLVDYPYGCTEQTLNRFLPTVITQKVLIGMHLDLKDIEKKRANLNAQEIGNDAKRAAGWKRNNPPNPGVKERNPVFDANAVTDMTKAGVERLTSMQLSDGGWGWFSGFGDQSAAHTTAIVVHGLQIARQNEVALVPGVLERGVDWLKRYQGEQVRMIKNAPAKTRPWKEHADDLDALAYMVLTDAKVQTGDMKDMNAFLYRDRISISVYAKAMYGLALFADKEQQKLDMILQNISQYVVEDNEDQTAYLKLPENNYWWCWYGSDTEAMAYYLKLLSRTNAKGAIASRLSKYLINNRKHASYWNSTRDTALVIEALADFIRASGESTPDEIIVISLDGKKAKEVKINADNLFSFDNQLVISGADVTAGPHKLEFSKTGTGPLYFNAYVTNFTLEDPIKKAGLEIKVQRQFYKLVQVDKNTIARGSLGQPVDERVEKYQRQPLADGAVLKSGDLVEVELEIDSKNDYEYILFEDMKASGFEPVDLRSGYNGNDLNAYMELHDERVCFFARELARGKHSVSYRLRAQVPGKFSALPTKASAMYAPELKANSDETKVQIVD